jgi:hypothetical protein
MGQQCDCTLSLIVVTFAYIGLLLMAMAAMLKAGHALADSKWMKAGSDGGDVYEINGKKFLVIERHDY